MRATWKYDDSDSGIHHVVWSVRVHHDGYGQHQPVDPIYVTSAEEGVHAQTVMYDNDEYFLTMLVCNGAELCMRQQDVSLKSFIFIFLPDMVWFNVINYVRYLMLLALVCHRWQKLSLTAALLLSVCWMTK